MQLIHYIKKSVLVFLVSSVVFIPGTSQSIPLKLTHEPLFINQSVPPALAITFDDSGSMGWGFMPDSNVWWNAPSLSSADYNLMFYNPAIEYRPPVRADGSSFPDSDFNNAKFDGFAESGDIQPRVDLNVGYLYMWISYPDYNAGTATTAYFNAGRPGPGRAYYHSWNGPGVAVHNVGIGAGANQYTLNLILPADETNFANWYTYYNTRGKLARAAVSHAFVNFGPDFKIDWQQINNNRFSMNMSTGTNMKLFSGTHREDFYSWLFTIPANGGTPLRNSFRRAGTLFTKQGVTGPYYDVEYGGELSCQQNFHIAISDGTWNGARGINTNADNVNETLPAIGAEPPYQYLAATLPSSMYAGADTETLADNAFEFWRRDLRTDLDNQVPAFIEDYTDRDGNIVTVASNENWWEIPELFWNPNNDPATWQHMVNFNIGLGLTGGLDRETDLPRLRDGTINWPTVTTATGRVDDVWHSSVNSRGRYLSARDPLELAAALDEVVSNIIKRKGRASSGSVSSSILTDETLGFRTGYDTSNWSGFVRASLLNSDGSLGNVIWDAACKLTGGPCSSMAGNPTVAATRTPATRNIFTYDYVSKSQDSFLTTNFSTLQINQLLNTNYSLQQIADGNPFTADDVVQYIRGDRSYEQKNGGDFRNRESLLGDVIHSPAIIVRGPSSTFSDDNWLSGTAEYLAANSGNGYQDFKNANKDRENILLVGANDGMLHAFDAGINSANGGDELWAYIPSKSFDNLSELANPIYKHTSFVDSSPFIQDAFINGAWGTFAVGGTRHGSKLFYALDLGTDPKNTPTVLWEFTDDDDPDMGFTYAGAIIIRVQVPSAGFVTKWVAILPNGYNSSSHKSVMYAVDLETGQLLHKWDTNNGSLASPNGMGPPVASDYLLNSDPTTRTKNLSKPDYMSEYVYAGDLHGNLYRFDMADIFSSTVVSKPELLYAGDITRSFTTAPRLFDAEGENIIVVAGTGKYIELSDRGILATTDQYMFGLLDSDNSISASYSLTDSRIVEQTISTVGNIRTFTNNPVDSTESWKVKMTSQGERMVTSLVGFADGFFAATIIPNGENPCLPGGDSWLMFMNPRTGGTPTSGKIFNGRSVDGLYIDDLVTGLNILTPPGGNTTILSIDGTGSGVDIGGAAGSTVTVDLGIGEKWRRRSWHRILID